MPQKAAGGSRGGSQEAPGGPRRLQEAPLEVPETSKRLPGGPRRLQEAPKALLQAPEGSRSFQEAPEGFQEAPGGSQRSPKTQKTPKSLPGASKRHLEAPQAGARGPRGKKTLDFWISRGFFGFVWILRFFMTFWPKTKKPS